MNKDKNLFVQDVQLQEDGRFTFTVSVDGRTMTVNNMAICCQAEGFEDKQSNYILAVFERPKLGEAYVVQE